MSKQRWLMRALMVVLVLAVFGTAALGLAFFGNQNVAQAQGATTGTPAASPQATSTRAASPQATSTTSSATPAATASPSGTRAAPATTSSIGDTFWRGLAAKLGVSVDTLKSNALQVRKDMLDQAAKDGRATQAQVDQLKQQLNADDIIAPINVGPGAANPQQPNQRNQPQPPFRRGQPQFPNMPNMPNQPRGGNVPGSPNMGMGMGMMGGQSLAVLEATAKTLSLSPADLVSQLSSGKTLADVATAQKVDQAKLKQAIVDARNAEIDRQVTDGLITQAEANALKSRVTTSNIDLTRPYFFFFR